jgi:hypothetical protein
MGYQAKKPSKTSSVIIGTLRRLDLDGNGRVSYVEFKKLFNDDSTYNGVTKNVIRPKSVDYH